MGLNRWLPIRDSYPCPQLQLSAVGVPVESVPMSGYVLRKPNDRAGQVCRVGDYVLVDRQGQRVEGDVQAAAQNLVRELFWKQGAGGGLVSRWSTVDTGQQRTVARSIGTGHIQWPKGKWALAHCTPHTNHGTTARVLQHTARHTVHHTRTMAPQNTAHGTQHMAHRIHFVKTA